VSNKLLPVVKHPPSRVRNIGHIGGELPDCMTPVASNHDAHTAAVPLTRYLQVGRNAVRIAPLVSMTKQRRAVSASLSHRINTDQRQVLELLGGVVFAHLVENAEDSSCSDSGSLPPSVRPSPRRSSHPAAARALRPQRLQPRGPFRCRMHRQRRRAPTADSRSVLVRIAEHPSCNESAINAAVTVSMARS
jgi:hypothetical protein